ncbi:MAG: SIS domain-containing protein [Planctomycetota bacterium]
MHDDAHLVRETAHDAARVFTALAGMAEDVVRVIATIRHALDAGGTVLTCGNGGSAAEALHLSEELIGRYKAERPPYRALCLSADPTALTCIANDYGYDSVFARQVAGLAREGDCLVALTTSGNSDNIRLALERARAMGVTTIGLLDKSGGACKDLCDHTLVIPSDATERIQEGHLLVIHQILEALESAG